MVNKYASVLMYGLQSFKSINTKGGRTAPVAKTQRHKNIKSSKKINPTRKIHNN